MIAFVLIVFALVRPAWADSHDVYQFKTTEQAAQFRYLTNELRCLVCQNQNLADSHAKLAEDLRQEVYEQVTMGRSNQAIILFLTKRYGDFVLYNPPVKSSTYILWFGPFILLLMSFAILFINIKRRSPVITE